jgi:hypothetical protein
MRKDFRGNSMKIVFFFSNYVILMTTKLRKFQQCENPRKLFRPGCSTWQLGHACHGPAHQAGGQAGGGGLQGRCVAAGSFIGRQ